MPRSLVHVTAGAISVWSGSVTVNGGTTFAENSAEYGGEAQQTTRCPPQMMGQFRGQHVRIASGAFR